MNTRTRILAEAFREILANGYKRADLVSIAQRAGVTKGGLFYYFKSKSDLALGVLELIDETLAQFPPGLMLEEPNESLIQLFPKSKRHHIPTGVEIARVLMKLASEAPRSQRAIHEKIERMVGGVVEGLASAIQFAHQTKLAACGIAPNELALLICAAAMGSVTMSEMFNSHSSVRRVNAALNQILGS